MRKRTGRDIVRWTAKETKRDTVQRKREKAMTNIECVHPALTARVMKVRKRKRKKGQDRGGKGLLLGGYNEFLEHAQV